MLDSAVENGEGDPEENAVRQKLWALRYGRPKKNMPPADGYAGLWITMNLWRRDTASRFRVRAAVKELGGMLRQLGKMCIRDSFQVSLQSKISSILDFQEIRLLQEFCLTLDGLES